MPMAIDTLPYLPRPLRRSCKLRRTINYRNVLLAPLFPHERAVRYGRVAYLISLASTTNTGKWSLYPPIQVPPAKVR